MFNRMNKLVKELGENIKRDSSNTVSVSFLVETHSTKYFNKVLSAFEEKYNLSGLDKTQQIQIFGFGLGIGYTATYKLNVVTPIGSLSDIVERNNNAEIQKLHDRIRTKILDKIYSATTIPVKIQISLPFMDKDHAIITIENIIHDINPDYKSTVTKTNSNRVYNIELSDY